MSPPSYGQSTYGFGTYGGMSSGIELVSSYPADGAQLVPDTQPLTFVFFSDVGAFDPDQIAVAVNGVDVLEPGQVWLTGWAGTFTDNGDGSWTLYIPTHPAFTTNAVTVVITYVEDGAAWIISFSTGLAVAAFKRAKTDCGGRRIDLHLLENSSVTIRIVRSKTAYASFVGDPGEVIYEGLPVPLVVDGDYSGPAPTTGLALEEGVFYYYSVFTRFGVSTPWETSVESRVQGLSIRDYMAAEGDYVYELMPEKMRARDAEAEKPYTLRIVCRILQCAVNLLRGHVEALANFRDPDTCPAGLTGVPDLQSGILAAFVQDLGLRPERSFDAGVLRRLALGLIPSLQRKGSCDGLRMFASVFTGWNVSACMEEGDANCGRVRFLTTWDMTQGRCGWARDTEWFPFMGYTRVYKTGLHLPKTGSLGALVTPSFVVGVPTVLSDGLGGVVCVDEIVDDGLYWRFNHTDPTSKLRDRVTITISGGETEFSGIPGPWNNPTPDMSFPANTFAGAVIRYGVGLAFTTTITDHLDGEDGVHETTFPASSMNDGDTAVLRPTIPMTMYQGEGSAFPDNSWDWPALEDYTLFSLWSVLSGGGSPLGAYAPTPGTARIVIEDVATKYSVDSVSESVIVFEGTPLSPSALVGRYLVANFRYPRVYRIVANTTNTIHVALSPGDPTLDVISEPGSLAVVLGPSDALKYQQLSRLILQFVPIDCEVVIDFN